MKKLLSSFLILFCSYFFSQNSMFLPYEGYSNQPITVTIANDNSTIYYTTDGSEPTLNSTSGANSIAVPISATTTFKAFNIRNGVTSPIETITYYIGNFSSYAPKLFFKPPANWSNSCVYMFGNVPRSMVDYFWPGDQMSNACEGWKTAGANFFEEGYVTFNNCNPYYPGAVYTPTLSPIDSTIFYDFTDGYITNPPACLLATTDVKEKAVSIKIFPNPVQDILKVDSEIKFSSYEILDASGKLLENKILTNNQLNVSNLKSGLYFIKLINAKKIQHYIRFIKN